jgi:hypothetical protein
MTTETDLAAQLVADFICNERSTPDMVGTLAITSADTMSNEFGIGAKEAKEFPNKVAQICMARMEAIMDE